MNANPVASGIPALDRLLEGGFEVGDNVVWIADRVADLEPYCEGLLVRGGPVRRMVRLSSSAVRPPADPGGVEVLGPSEPFPTPAELEAVLLAADVGAGAKVVISSLDDLVTHWGVRQAVDFYTHTCPRLFDRGAIAYWLASRDLSGPPVVDEVSRVAQCVLDVRPDRLRVRKAEGRPLRVQGATVKVAPGEGDAQADREHTAGRLGEGLRRLRMDRGLSQRQLAQLAGVTPAAISQAEAGRRGLSLDTLVPLCESLGVSLDDLLGIGSRASPWLARHDRVGVDLGGTVPLFDDADSGVRVHLVDLEPGGSGAPPVVHKGPELVMAASGLVLVELGSSTPVLRSGDALMVSDVAVSRWTNLAPGPSRLFWVAL